MSDKEFEDRAGYRRLFISPREMGQRHMGAVRIGARAFPPPFQPPETLEETPLEEFLWGRSGKPVRARHD